jgi:hypothetical protein
LIGLPALPNLLFIGMTVLDVDQAKEPPELVDGIWAKASAPFGVPDCLEESGVRVPADSCSRYAGTSPYFSRPKKILHVRRLSGLFVFKALAG